MLFFDIIAIRAQDVLFIEEKAIILRIEFKFIIDKALIILLNMILILKVMVLVHNKRNIGIIFCQLNKIKFLNHEIPSLTSGNQK